MVRLCRAALDFGRYVVAGTAVICLMFLLRGVSGHPTESSVATTHSLFAHAPLGPSLRACVSHELKNRSNIAFVGALVDEATALDISRSLGHLEPALEPAPACLNAPDVNAPPSSSGPSRRMPGVAGLRLYDSGAGVHGRNGDLEVVPGSIEKNTLAVSTANGVTVPPTKCTQILPLKDVQGRISHVHLRDSVDLENCAYTLVSSGKLAAEEGVGFWLAPHDGLSFLRPDMNDTSRDVPLLNIGVMVIPNESVDATACSGVVFGDHNNDVSNLDEFVHDTFNHRDLKRIRHTPDCTNAPESWRKLKLRKTCSTCAHCTCKR